MNLALFCVWKMQESGLAEAVPLLWPPSSILGALRADVGGGGDAGSIQPPPRGPGGGQPEAAAGFEISPAWSRCVRLCGSESCGLALDEGCLCQG